MSDQHPHNDPALDEATGGILLVLTPGPWSRYRARVTPVVTINGRSMRARWDSNVYALPAGRHRIQVRLRYLWTGPPVEYDAEVKGGQMTSVHYTGPTAVLIKGSLGATPQQSRGDRMWGMATVAIVGAMLLILSILLVLGTLDAL